MLGCRGAVSGSQPLLEEIQADQKPDRQGGLPDRRGSHSLAHRSRHPGQHKGVK